MILTSVSYLSFYSASTWELDPVLRREGRSYSAGPVCVLGRKPNPERTVPQIIVCAAEGQPAIIVIVPSYIGSSSININDKRRVPNIWLILKNYQYARLAYISSYLHSHYKSVTYCMHKYILIKLLYFTYRVVAVGWAKGLTLNGKYQAHRNNGHT